MRDPLPIILAGTIGAGTMLVLQPPPVPPACEPVELVRFVGPQPEIHVVETPVFGRTSDEWLTQFEPETEPEQDETPIVRRRRRHVR